MADDPFRIAVAHQTKIRTLVSDRVHPDVIDEYLIEKGYSSKQIDEVYLEMNLRREHLVDCHKMKRNVRIVGMAVIAVGCLLPVINAVSGGMRSTLLVSLGLTGYGLYMAVSGSFLIYKPE